MELNTLKVPGFELKYKIEGEGPTAIVIGSALYHSRTFSENLRKHLRFVFFDHRGFGKATQNFNEADFTIEHIINDIESLRKTLNLEKMILIGHSGQGHFALEYAKEYPEYVSDIIIIGMSPDSTPESFAAADQYLEDSVCPERKAVLSQNMALLEEDLQNYPEQRFKYYVLRSSARTWYDFNFDASYLWEDVTIIPEMFDEVWGKHLRELDILDDLDRIEIPVMVALGRYDYWNPPHLWNSVRDAFEDITIRVFEKSGHTPQLEEPELFDQELLDWLHIEMD